MSQPLYAVGLLFLTFLAMQTDAVLSINKAKLGQLTDGTGKGSEASRSSMLQYGEDMLRLMTQKYGNASGDLDGTDKQLLRDIIGIISGTMYASMTSDHLEDQAETNSSHQAVVDCNDALVAAVAGMVSEKRTSTNTAREAHSDCRDGAAVGGLLQVAKGTSSDLPHESQEEACDNAHNKEIALNSTVTNLPNPPLASAFAFPVVRSLDLVTAFFTNENVYVTWFNNHKDSFFLAKNESESTREECDSHAEACDNKQAVFEAAYDAFRHEYQTTCNTSSSCYGSTTNAYTAVKARVTATMDNRKAAYEAGQTIIYKIECLLGDHLCEVPDGHIDASEYVLTFPDVPNETTCDASEVLHQHCTETFRNTEYSQFQGHVAVATGLDCP